MLNQIHIRDLATIEELHLNLNDGSTMITGETGAGKSIFIEAIELALGGRASSNMIRPGKEKAEISLGFDITRFPKVIDHLKQVDLYHDAPECIIRRVVGSDGRSRCYVNGSPSTLPFVKELGEMLFHLHSQHEQQVLLKAETQREMLDRFADHAALVNSVKQLAESHKATEHDIHALQEMTRERTKRSEYLRFQLDELEQLKLQAGEWENLEAEHKRLAHAEELIRNIQLANQLLVENENNNVISQLNEIRKILENIVVVDATAKEWLGTLNSAVIQITDLESELQNYLESTDLDPEKLQATEERVSVIFNLARKHKIPPAELFSFQERIAAELNALSTSDEDLLQLKTELTQIALDYHQAAEKLTKSRQKASSKLEKEITTTIRSLSLPHGDFHIELESDTTSLSPYGHEKIIFLIKTNPDQPLQSLKVISGGELSRLSLAAHLALAHRTSIPTLVFDEVDTGLSGATAEKIGRLLRKLGDSYQVFCVTHQAQVAVCGHHHLFVEKYFIEKTTHTRLRLLDKQERTQEMARMLSGEKITEKTMAHAKEMLEELAGV
ncbi:MAG: DNA repair protein RecN [Gammaproteobacteria bacterium]